MVSMGVIRAEGNSVDAVVSGDKFVIQRFTSYTGTNNVWVPYEATVDEVASFAFGGRPVLAVGRATLVAGTVTVALTTITAASLVFLTTNDATPNAVGVTVTAGTGFTITSASGADTSVVNYIVLS